MSSELSYEASDEASENELLERSLSVWRGWSAIEWEDFTPIALDIHTACSIGHFEWVRSIIVKNEDIALDRKNRGGWTPLMYACYIGHDNIVNLLINAGCNMNMKNTRGHTPLMLAASCGNESVARTLVRRGAQLELIDKQGWTALFHATYAGHQNFVEFLLDAGANKDAVEPSTGITPFMEAASEGHEIIVQQFLQHGVNVHAKAYNGDMARSLALMNGYMKIVSLIDNHMMPVSHLRTEADLDSFHSSSDEAQSRKFPPSSRNLRLKSQGPSIRDGPEAIARMIDRTRHTDAMAYPNSQVPKGYMAFPACGVDKEETKLSYRDVTSPINPDDYKDSSGGREFDDFNDDSNAFTKTGAITIKSSSSSSGGLIAALGLSREGSIDSDDSRSYDQTTSSSDGILEDVKHKHASTGSKGACLNEDAVPTISTTDSSEDPIDPQETNTSTSHSSPSKDTTKLSPLKMPDKGHNSSHLEADHPDSGAVSPLRDYFPLDSSFTIGTAAPPATMSAAADRSSSQHQNMMTTSDSSQSLPKENMTHAEIVNRFLKNLTLDNSGRSSNEFNGHQPRWAPETNDSIPDTADDKYKLPNTADESSLMHAPHETASAAQIFPSNIAGSHGLPNEVQIQGGINMKTGVATVQEAVPSMTGNMAPSFPADPNSRDMYAGHFHPGQNLGHQKETPALLQGQQRTHHPQLNHHHPLHNRHHHNSLPSVQDCPSGNIRNTPPRLNNVHHPASHQVMPGQQANMTAPYIHNLPQEYFYSDIETASQFHQPSFVAGTSSIPIQNQNTAVGIAHTTADYGTQLSPAVNPLSHIINPLVDNSNFDLQYKTDASTPPNITQTSQTQVGQVVSGVKQEGSISHSAINHPPSKINGANQMGIDSYLQNPQLPAAATASSPSAQGQPQHSSPLPPSQSTATPSSSSAQASVIIPGHATSQPVLNSIGWLDGGGPRQEGPRDLAEMLTQLGLTKYLEKFEEQDVDLQVFLSLTDNDLKELGIKLFGPRKKMTNAIARWHSHAPIASNSLEQAYADKLEGEMQEMAIQLNQAYENEERLKAQVLQEQQLRSVTEGCLMEERASWEQARQVLQETRAKMRMMGDLMSRLRLHQKELRKQVEKVSRQKGGDGSNTSSSAKSVDGKVQKDIMESKDSVAASKSVTGSESLNQPVGAKNATASGNKKEGAKKMGNPDSSFNPISGELLKKSEKCLKEMQQTLTGLVLNAEHILKSTHNISNIESKDMN